MAALSIQQQRQKVIDFIKGHKLAVLATVDQHSLPEAAVIGFSSGDNFELYFGTSIQSRKSINLGRNPRVALVVGWDKGKTVQYEGEASQLSRTEAEAYKKISLADVPSIAKYNSTSDTVLYRIKPKFIKYADVSTDPWEVFQFQEFE